MSTRESRPWPLSPREVLRWSLRTYSQYAGRLLALALLIVVPVEIVLNQVDVEYLATANRFEWSKFFAVLGAVAVLAIGTQVGELFYSGLVDHLVESHRHDEAPPTLGSVFRGVPYWTLFWAEFAVLGLVAIGTMFFIVPGIVLFVLFALVGPLVMIERRGAGRALLRSVALMRHAFWRASWLLFGVAVVSEGLEALAHALEHRAPASVGWMAEGLVIMLLAPVSGLVRVHLAHELLTIERDRT